MFKTIKYLLLILSGSCLTIITLNQEAYGLSARARATWSFQETDSRDTNNDGSTTGEGSYQLGGQTIRCNTTNYRRNSRTRNYADRPLNTPDRLNFNRSCSRSEKVTTANASSTMTVLKQTSRNFFDWELDLSATVDREAGSPSGIAVARGSDPQYLYGTTIDSPGENQITFFEEEVTLGSGSSVFVEDEKDEAFTIFTRESTLLEDPIFSIEIFGLGSASVDAVVNFNSDSSLTFSTTASALESLLEDPSNGLGTDDGLLSDISFSYSWDLSDFSITPHDTIGGGGESFAQSGQSVSEPTSSLGFLALGILGATSTLKRKLKSAKKQKPEKVW